MFTPVVLSLGALNLWFIPATALEGRHVYILFHSCGHGQLTKVLSNIVGSRPRFGSHISVSLVEVLSSCWGNILMGSDTFRLYKMLHSLLSILQFAKWRDVHNWCGFKDYMEVR